MKKRDFSDNEHFLRLCSRQRQIRDTNGVIQGVTWEAFSLRTERKETYLSGALFECCNDSKKTKLRAALHSWRMGSMHFKNEHAIAICPAGDIRAVGKKQSKHLLVRFEPSKHKPFYAVLRGLPLDNSDNRLLAMLASICVASCHLVKDIEKN